MGKTSLWLNDDLAAEAKATGESLSELVRRGVHASDPDRTERRIREIVSEALEDRPTADEVRSIVREELERVAGQSHA
jgi:hypothetical protein